MKTLYSPVQSKASQLFIRLAYCFTTSFKARTFSHFEASNLETLQTFKDFKRHRGFKTLQNDLCWIKTVGKLFLRFPPDLCHPLDVHRGRGREMQFEKSQIGHNLFDRW